MSEHIIEVTSPDSAVEVGSPGGAVEALNPHVNIYYGGAPTAGVTDHGALTGLADDDHPQYLTPARVAPLIPVVDDTPLPIITG